MSDPENVFDLAGSYPIIMHVRGVLAPTGTADDGAVFVDIKTEWLIMGIMHGHQDVEKADPSLLLGRDTTNNISKTNRTSRGHKNVLLAIIAGTRYVIALVCMLFIL